MPTFIPNQMQGGGNTATTAIAAGVTAVLLLEWGHFINTSTNLLFADGGVQLTNTSAASATTVTLTITQDGATIDTRVVSLPTSASDSVSVGSRQANLSVGHHVYNLLATSSATAVTAGNKEVSTISGPAS